MLVQYKLRAFFQTTQKIFFPGIENTGFVGNNLLGQFALEKSG
jgi:hypothetical protein